MTWSMVTPLLSVSLVWFLFTVRYTAFHISFYSSVYWKFTNSLSSV